MKPIFAYLKTSEFDKDQIKKIKLAGYLPIAVNSFDDFKIEMVVPTQSTSEILKIAGAAILSNNFTAEKFGILMADYIQK